MSSVIRMKNDAIISLETCKGNLEHVSSIWFRLKSLSEHGINIQEKDIQEFMQMVTKSKVYLDNTSSQLLKYCCEKYEIKIDETRSTISDLLELITNIKETRNFSELPYLINKSLAQIEKSLSELNITI